MTDRITANLPARDFDETAAFYERLGFRVDFKDNDWMMMSCGPLEIEFFPHRDLDPEQSYFSACIRVMDLDRLYGDYARLNLPGAGIPRLQGPPWTVVEELRIFAVIDPNGSLLRCLGE
jgi:catechol 2,3-dioxygenase-like lactoylglutathione lyase family enzyme